MIGDLRHALRVLAKRPAFTLVAVLTLGLGIGASTSVVSVVDAVLLRPYPHIETDRWAYLWETSEGAGLSELSASIPNFRDWKQESRSFADLVLWMPWGYNVSGPGSGDAERVEAAVITADVFTALGIRPAAGRLLLASDSPKDGVRPVFISYGLWQRRFGGDPGVAGRTIILNGVPHTVIGVAPPGFSFPPETSTEVWTPYPADDIARDAARGGRGYRVAGRLRAGVSFEVAQAEMSVIAARLARAYPDDDGYGVRVIPMRQAVAGDFRAPLMALLGAVLLVVLLACVNLANLQLVRLEARQRELAVRTAVGAGRGRLVRQLVAESVVLMAAGGAAGLVVAPAGVRLLLSFVPPREIPYLKVTTDLVVLLAFAGVTLAVTLLSGVLPAIDASRVDPVRALASGTRTGSGGGGRRARHVFLVAQLALSVVPLVGAGLLVRSFDRLRRVDPGFRADHGLTLSFFAPRARYASPEAVAALAEEVRDAVAGLPGVTAAGLAQSLPFAPAAEWAQAFCREDPKGIANPGTLPHVRFNVVTTRYAEALGVPLRAGRTFARTDAKDAGPVVIVNQALVRRFFPHEDPIGQRVWVGHAPDLATTAPHTIVGVVGDTLLERLDGAAAPAAWVPVSQQQFGELVWRTMFLVVRTADDPLRLASAVRDRIRGLDPGLAVTDVATLETRLAESVWRQRLLATVLVVFGLAALAIAVLGVFGIVSFLVGRRTREIGVRMALGATARDIRGMVLSEGLRLVACGVALGAAGALVLGRGLSGLLYGVRANDPATFAAVAVGLASAALLACAFPARRAARTQPLEALRQD